jgi:hypothetical protein
MQRVKGAIKKRRCAYSVCVFCIIVFIAAAIGIGEVSLAVTNSGPVGEKERRTSKKRQNQEPETQRESKRHPSDVKNVHRSDAAEKKALRASRIRKPTTENIEPVEIHSGFVISEGRYMPPPYIVRSRQGKVFVNDIEVRDRNRPQITRRFMGIRSMNPTFSRQPGTYIEQHLRRDGMLICSSSRPAAYLTAQEAIPVLDVLMSDEQPVARIQTLLQAGPDWMAKEQWKLIAGTFDAPAELAERVETLKYRLSESEQADTDYEWSWAFLSAITMAGFVLSVWALGTLLACRPPMIPGRRAKVLSGNACRQVIWLVVLIVILNLYDLVCTLFAHGVGGLWELNPFAGRLIQDVPMVVMFKLALTAGAAILFLVTRHHRLTQIGSWWIGVVYTVLILRWTTFNSIFL